MPALAVPVAVAVAGAVAACGGGSGARPQQPLPPDERPVPIGRGAGYRPAAISPAVRRRAPIAGLRCTPAHARRYAVHLELYARRLVLPVPSGIGVAPPQRRQGAYVLAGACSYPIRTFEPTGVVLVDTGRTLTVGDLFAIWGQPLSSHSLARFRGPVLAFVDGRRRPGSPARIALRRHAEIVLVLGEPVLPHPAYHFPPGL